MLQIQEHWTIHQAVTEAALRYASGDLLVVPGDPERSYHPNGYTLSFEQAAQAMQALADVYRAAGYGFPHRIGLFLANRPEHLAHKLAMNSLGICCVPINPDYRAAELVYLVEHSRLDLIVTHEDSLDFITQSLAGSQHQPPVITLGPFEHRTPPAARAYEHRTPRHDTPASILYTSGTTGRPKGCVLSHRYELASGDWYARQGGLVSVRPGQERLYNPLPLFHVNASILSFYCMLLTGNCQIQPERFRVSRWWEDVRQTRATIVHYLGVIIPMLLKQPESALDRQHQVRLGYGAGVEPELHALFEARFGFPLVELWGMTEMVRVLSDRHEPRKRGTRAFGRAEPGLDVQVVDAAGQPVPDGTPGEMVIRYSADTPRKDFFTGYLDDPQATETAWRGGWFHTGDVVTRDTDGMLHFVDRDKNIIRRAGENIAAAEVEATLLLHPRVQQVAVLAAPDEIREAEVLACIVLKPDPAAQAGAQAVAQAGGPAGAAGLPDARLLARELFDFCFERLAYYKVPGWWWFTPEIPTTGTQKIQKHRIFPAGADPRGTAGMIDLRALKKRNRAP
ncbi:AMP-binding protein [Castellaniella sp.]|uniref:AMP-binding protein n=1 Tax=Castellaniella sp. TaxID=1955812 RepID=UPI00356968D2